ncbi:hypothetical protein [Agromyces sp. Root1464]|uniref:hypothetical protein n=1 Tax=Agromyces sp. Root1464 TaxID=1736467 RepID=UPI000A535614|nr:hypothetical protein [Agromyces sp. Root1464]
MWPTFIGTLVADVSGGRDHDRNTSVRGNMDSDWIGAAIAVVLLIFIALVAAVGASSQRSPNWDDAFRDLAERELAAWDFRRGELTTDVEATIAALLPTRKPPDAGFDALGNLRAALHLTGMPVTAASIAGLESSSEAVLAEALDRQRKAVEGATSVGSLRRRWQFGRTVNALVLWRHGVVWFVPKWLRRVGAVAAPTLGAAAVVGPVLGFAAWFIGRYAIVRNETFPSWTTTVGELSTAVLGFAIFGLCSWQIWSMTKQLRSISHQPGVKDAVRMLIALAVLTGVAVLSGDTTATREVKAWNDGAILWMESTGVAEVLGALVMAGLLVVLIRNVLSRISDARRPWSERLLAIGLALFLFVLLVAVAFFLASRTGLDVAVPIGVVAGGVILTALIGVVAMLLSLVEHFTRERAIWRAGLRTGGGTLTIVAVSAFAGVMVTLAVATAVFGLLPEFSTSPLAPIFGLQFFWAALLFTPSTVLIVVVIWLRTRSVDRIYRIWRRQGSPSATTLPSSAG